MSEKIVIEMLLTPSVSKKGEQETEKKAKKAGAKAGKEFTKEFENKTINVGKALKSSFLGLGATLATVAIGRTFVEGIRLAQVQEDAVNRLNNSLKLTGELTQDQSRDLQEYASSLQNASRYGDEVILNNLALAKSFGASNEQAKKILSASVDLAEVMGIDLQSAVRNISKSLGGYAGELGESIPQLKELSKTQLQAGEGIDLIAQKFQGQGKNLGTYSFNTTQLSNAFGDLLESIGAFVTKNSVIITSLQKTTSYINSFTDGLKGIQIGLNLATDKPVGALGKIDSAIEKNIDRTQELKDTIDSVSSGVLWTGFLSPVQKKVLKESQEEIKKLDMELSNLVETRNKALSNMSKEKQLQEERKKQAKDEADRTRLLGTVAVQNEARIKEATAKRITALDELEKRKLINEQEASNTRAFIYKQQAEQIEAFRKSQQQKNTEADELEKERIRNLGILAVQNQERIQEATLKRYEALKFLEDNALISEQEASASRVSIAQSEYEQMQALREKEDAEKNRLKEAQIEREGSIADATMHAFRRIKTSKVELGKTLSNLAIQGYGNTFKQIGVALKKGEGINKAFEESTRQAFANVASASGDYYILEGGARIAKSYGADATGYKMVGIGTALKVLGGYLGSDKGSSGASAGGGAGGAGADTGSSLQDTTALDVQDVERGEPQTNVEVVVQGSLVQQEELGTFLAETLSESFGKQGVSLTDARFT